MPSFQRVIVYGEQKKDVIEDRCQYPSHDLVKIKFTIQRLSGILCEKHTAIFNKGISLLYFLSETLLQKRTN